MRLRLPGVCTEVIDRLMYLSMFSRWAEVGGGEGVRGGQARGFWLL